MKFVPTDLGEKLLTLDCEELPSINKEEYEKISDLVTGFIQQVMKSRYNMQEVWIGDDKKPNGPKANIFISEDFYTNTGRCIVLI